MSKRPRMSLTLSDLIAHLNTISKEQPELLGEPVEINFDSGCFREIFGVAVNPISKRVVISEDFIESSSFK
jgi:hypothetical protein